MQVFSPNDINIYDLSGGKNLPDFLTQRKRKELLRKDVSMRRRIDLIQDFTMPSVNTRVKVSNDGQYIYTAGSYKPTIKCFETSQLSMKFERCVDFEVVDFHILTDDYQKIAFLGSDRTIQFHTSQGRHATLRIPKFGREIDFYPANSELLVAGSGNEVYRISLEEGRFLQPYTMAMEEAMTIAVSPEHYLVALGGSDSVVECWDPRARSAVGCVKLPISDSNRFADVTKVVYLSGLEIAAGTDDGRVVLFDLRQRSPLMVKDHMYEKPITQIAKKYVSPEKNWIVSTCSKSLKIWEADTGKAVTAVEPPARINHAQCVDNSGLIFLALEQEKMQTYFIPELGPAPRWCAFLDMLTEELEESKTDVIYDDYKFLTVQELKALSLESLIGTNLLRAVMHGYFIDNRLYQKAKAASDPFAFEEYKQKQIDSAIRKERKRIPVVDKVPVNTDLYVKMKESGKDEVIQDDRFANIFTDKDFGIDKESERYNQLKPVSATHVRKRKDSSSEDENQPHDENLMPDVFAPEKRSTPDSDEDSLDNESDSEQEEIPQPKRQVRTKKMTVRTGVDLSQIYDPKNTSKLKEQRRVEEQIPMSRRLGNGTVAQSRRVQGGKVFEMQVGKDKKDKEASKATRKHVQERRTNIRKAESLMKKHRPKKT